MRDEAEKYTLLKRHMQEAHKDVFDPEDNFATMTARHGKIHLDNEKEQQQ